MVDDATEEYIQCLRSGSKASSSKARCQSLGFICRRGKSIMHLYYFCCIAIYATGAGDTFPAAVVAAVLVNRR